MPKGVTGSWHYRWNSGLGNHPQGYYGTLRNPLSVKIIHEALAKRGCRFAGLLADRRSKIEEYDKSIKSSRRFCKSLL